MTSPDFAAPQTGNTLANGRGDVGAAGSVLREPTGPTIPLNRLAPEAALRRLELTIVRRLEGFLQGDHLGLMPGPGSDLNDARIYVPGQDDVRRMDWAVTARTTIPHVRDTIADRELEVWALLDATPSMNWGTAGVTKRDLGIAAIATLGFVSQKMGDRFGGMVMHSDSVHRFPARSGRQALYGLLGKLLDDPIERDNQPSLLTLSDGIEAMIRTQRRRGMRIVVSDFLTPGDEELDPGTPPAWERPLRRLAVRNQVLCVEVMDAGEIEFPDVGELLIRDPETDFARYVNTSDPRARKMIDGASQAQRQRVDAAMRRAGVGHLRLQTDRDWVQDIARFVLTYRRTAAVLHTPPQGVAR
ncbi:DUF58 domain-containing protein [Brooklawnia cerclae]|uniref:Uncharacterized protein (DUF58 family) n=1 Tax=Brooklawnia cerclae TaxID=349934 RepID=A0ABX0SFU6_9ACTN|nr:DUF58 domain-containing protein [Brooklawnia cerclae]NIH56198.1 uncharacterized protein (DUF58 family) [Brooklawnia cerclae]